jgi:PhzF family phenazine biosynthesis protein
MKSRPFTQVDVFTEHPYSGNPVAVVLDGAELDDETMQQFAQWTQLSETTFVLPPTEAARSQGADYRVRIFTPGGELPFAGHPTLGTAHAWREAGGKAQNPDRVVQECGVGLVHIQRAAPLGAWAFAGPALQRHDVEAGELQTVCEALGLDRAQILWAQHLNNGPQWLGLLLDNPTTVLHLLPDHAALKKTGIKVGVAALHATQPKPALIGRVNREAMAFGQTSPHTTLPQAKNIETAMESALEVRAFAAAIGIPEDPVTGSLNASLAQWLIAEGLLGKRYTASQGTVLGREGRIYIEQDPAGQVWVGGQAVTCIKGHVYL